MHTQSVAEYPESLYPCLAVLDDDSFPRNLFVLAFLSLRQCAVARFFCWNQELGALVFILESLIPQIQPDFKLGEPILMRRKLHLQQGIVVSLTLVRTADIQNQLQDAGNDNGFYRVAFFLPL